MTSKKKAKFLLPCGSTLPLHYPLLNNEKFKSSGHIRWIGKIICKFNSNKAQGHDMISICMLKKSGKFISKSLHLIFNSYLLQMILLSEWKKVNAVPIHKKMTNSVSQTIGLSLFTRFWTFFLWHILIFARK